MRGASYARLLFGASAVFLGVVLLLRPDSELWQDLHPLGTPLATALAWCLTIAQITGGIGVMYSRTARLSSIVLGVVYLFFSLANVPGMIAAPGSAIQYIVFFEQFSLVCGAIAVYAATQTNAAHAFSAGHAARVGLGICALSFGWAQIVYLQYTASLVPTWIPPGQVFWTNFTTIAFALAGVAILINVQGRLAIRLMTLMIVLFGILVWVPRIAAHPHVLSNWDEIASNYLMAGAAWLVAELPIYDPGAADSAGSRKRAIPYV